MQEEVKITSSEGRNQLRPRVEFGFNRGHLWWQVLALVAISFVSVYASGAFDDEFNKLVPEKSILISTYNKRQSGLSGLYELLNRLGHKPKRWVYPYRQLSEFKGCLVITAPIQSLRDYEVEQILNWVKKGNDLVYLDDFKLGQSRFLPSQLEISVKTAVKQLNKEKVKIDKNFDWLSDLDSIRVTSSARLLGGTSLASDDSGPVITMINHGDGRVILASAPGMLSNDLISDSKNWNNFQLLENWFQGRLSAANRSTVSKTIYFDERVHGFTGGRNVFAYLSRGPFGLVSMQLILIALVVFFSRAQRFGAAIQISGARRISNMDFIDGLANAYRRARANAPVLEILFHSFRVKVSKLLGVSSHEKDEMLINAWKNSPISRDVDLESLIEEYNRLVESRSVGDQEMLKIIATCDKITDADSKGAR